MRKPIQKDVIEKPNLQLDEQNVVQTASGESGDGVGNNPTNDANVNGLKLQTKNKNKNSNNNEKKKQTKQSKSQNPKPKKPN